MKAFVLSLLLFGAAAILAMADQAAIVTPGTVIAQPDLTQPLGKEWLKPRGLWTPVNGVLTATQIPAQKHAAVLTLKTGPTPMIIECDFMIGPKQVFTVGCNGAKGHVGRVTITAGNVAIAENTPLNGKATNHVLVKQPIKLLPTDWQHLRVECAGDKFAVWLNQTALEGEHPFLATPKAAWFFAATTGVKVRNLRLTGGTAAAVAAAP